MNVTGKLKDILSRVSVSLTSLDSRPLSKAALVVIIFLDIFILISIFDGLDEHTRQLSSPDDYIPYTCRDIVINKEWNPANRTDNLSSIITSYSNSYYQIEEKKKTLHPLCAPYLDLIDQIKVDKELAVAFEDRNKFHHEAKDLQREIGNLKGAYDTSLLETISKQQEEQVNVDKIRKDVQEKSNTLNILLGQIQALELTINENGKVTLLWGRLHGLQQADREKLRADLRNLNFWYPLRKLGMQLIFLLPLLAIFYAWNNTSIRKSRGIQALVSSHLLAISFIPIFFKIIETVYDIIPKILLKKLIELLESLNLVAIWYYLVIALAVAVSLLIIYIFQKKLFSWEKLIERRITKGQCQGCGKQLRPESQFCSFCGFSQVKPCSSCHKSTLVFGKYCLECGKIQ